MKHGFPKGNRKGQRGDGREAPLAAPFGNDRGAYRQVTGRLPETAIVQVAGTDPDGDAIARVATWDKALGPPPLILMHAELPGRPALAPGEKVLARL